MGVNISIRTKRNAEIDLNPGWRSMMEVLLRENNLIGEVNKSDIPRLREIRDTQMKGERDPPFDWAQSIADSFDKIIEIVGRDGFCTVVTEW